MKPNLNKADIELLKGTFATKDDLVAMEARQNKRFATKDDLKAFATKDDLVAMEKRIRLMTKEDLTAMEIRFNETFPTKKEIGKQFEDLAVIIADSFAIHEKRISNLEQNAQDALI